MTFLASSREDIAGLEKAARRTGLQHLSADRASGVLVFTAGRTVLAFGEKVTARIREVAPGTVQVGRLRHRPIWGMCIAAPWNLTTTSSRLPRNCC